MSDIGARLLASLRYDAVNGTPSERAIVTQQMREAAQHIATLTAERNGLRKTVEAEAIKEIERLQAALRNAQISEQHWRDEAQKERDLDDCYETAFNNVCIAADIDLGMGRNVLEEELTSIAKAAAEAAKE